MFSILTVVLLFTACKKNFLDRSPQDAYSNSSLWTDANDATAALAGVYNGQYWSFSDDGNGWADATWIVYLDCASDNAYSQYPWEGFQGYGNGTATPASVGVTNASAYNYTAITRCNFFLANIGNTPMDDTLKANMIAQVRFIRAYEYSIMTELYGDVPLVTSVLTPAQSLASTRTPKATVVKFILSELAAAAPELTAANNSGDGHITRGAALALKARMELYTADYTDCVTDCQAVMKLGYALYPSYSDLFRMVAQNNNPEIIASAQYVENPSANANGVLGVMPSNSSGGWSSIDPLQSLVDSYEMANGKPITDPTSGYDPTNPYANRDPRLAATILFPGEPFYQSSGAVGVLSKNVTYFDPLDASSPDYYASDNNTSQTGYVVKKYTSNLSDFDNLFQSGLNMPVIRYAEVLLTDAEAKIELNKIDATVYSDINAVRNRAGMPSVDQSVYNSQTTLRTLVRNERRVEFAFEGLRFFDIQRWQIGTTAMNGPVYGAKTGTVDAGTGKYTITGAALQPETRVFASKNYLWPIPQSERDIDKQITQNPGY